MEVNKKITFLREQKGLTVNKLANQAGISQSFLREIELSMTVIKCKKTAVKFCSFMAAGK